jgi:hypothetical protein
MEPETNLTSKGDARSNAAFGFSGLFAEAGENGNFLIIWSSDRLLQTTANQGESTDSDTSRTL